MRQDSFADNDLLLVAARKGKDRQPLVGNFDVDIPDLLVDAAVLLLFIQERAFGIAFQAGKGNVLADAQRLNQALALPVLRHHGEAARDLLRHASDPDRLAVEQHLALVLRPQPHQALENFRAARAQQTVDAENLPFPDGKADVVQQVPAAAFRQGEVLYLQNDRGLLPVDIAAALRVCFIPADHPLDDPWDVDFVRILVRHVFPVAQDRDVVADVQDLFQAVGNVHDRDPLRRQLAHDPEQHIHLLRAQGGRRFVHDQDFQVLLNQIPRDLDDLLLPHAQVPHQRFRRDGVLQLRQNPAGQLGVLLVVQPEMPLRLFPGHKDVLVDVQVREQAQLLMDDPDPVPACVRRVLEGDLLIPHKELAGSGLLDSRNDLHQRGFSRAVFPDQHVDLPFFHREGNVVERHGARIDFTDILRPQADLVFCFFHGTAPPIWPTSEPA